MRKCSDSALTLRKTAALGEKILRVGSQGDSQPGVSFSVNLQQYGDAKEHELDTAGSPRFARRRRQQRR